MNCLCGHFEWCEHCRTKPDDPEVLKRMTVKDWQRSVRVTIPEDPKVRLIGSYWRTIRVRANDC